MRTNFASESVLGNSVGRIFVFSRGELRSVGTDVVSTTSTGSVPAGGRVPRMNTIRTKKYANVPRPKNRTAIMGCGW